MEKNKFYVTTPIYYANAEPHIGTAYTTLAADVVSRYYREKYGKKNVLFQVGTDEHGQKIAEAAKKADKKPKEFVDELIPVFKKAWRSLGIDYEVFVRTTDDRHKKVASRVLQKIYDEGYIYEDDYEGYYCVGCEKYITEKELVDGRCPDHPNREVEWQKEKNYFFKLSEFAPKVQQLIEKGKVEILPKHREKEVLNRIKEGVEDISISRESVEWGIPIPWDKEQKSTLWVWIEALLNYYSVTEFKDEWKRFWPADLHLVGKDILWFHTTVWFSLLLAADLPLPKQVFGHGFFTIDGQKISKSLGNVILPEEFVDKFGKDGARYLLISATSFGSDRNIKKGEFEEKYQADLANGLGNLVARVEAMVKSLSDKLQITNNKLQINDGEIPDQVRDDKMEISKNVAKDIEEYRFDKGLDKIWERVRGADRYINQEKVWELEGRKRVEALSKLVEEIRQIGYDLKPFLPETADEVIGRFEAEKIKKGESLFERI